jgi:protein phosphatase
LVGLAKERGATDNVTVIVARYTPRGSTIVYPQPDIPASLWDRR